MSPPRKTSGSGGGLPRLPPGRHGLPREFVVENQRQRLAAGMIQVVAERGYHDTSISQIAAAAGISRRTFYGYFASKEECFLDTFEMVAEFLFARMEEAGASERGWPGAVRARLRAMLEVFGANPDLARFTLVAPSAAGGPFVDRYRALLEQLLAVLAEGRPRNARRPGEAAEHGLVGGIATLLVDRVEAGEGESLLGLLPDLTELTLTPYMGRERAVAAARVP